MAHTNMYRNAYGDAGKLQWKFDVINYVLMLQQAEQQLKII